MPFEDSSLDDLCQICPHPRRVHVHFGAERLPTCMYCTSVNNVYDHVFELASAERAEEYRQAYAKETAILAARKAADVPCLCECAKSYHLASGECVRLGDGCGCKGFEGAKSA